MHLCRHLAKYRHIVSDPNGRVPKSSTYHNMDYAQFLRCRFSAFQFSPRTAIMINRVWVKHLKKIAFIPLTSSLFGCCSETNAFMLLWLRLTEVYSVVDDFLALLTVFP